MAETSVNCTAVGKRAAHLRVQMTHFGPEFAPIHSRPNESAISQILTVALHSSHDQNRLSPDCTPSNLKRRALKPENENHFISFRPSMESDSPWFNRDVVDDWDFLGFDRDTRAQINALVPAPVGLPAPSAPILRTPATTHRVKFPDPAREEMPEWMANNVGDLYPSRDGEKHFMRKTA
jgi:hypothetical protein